MTMGRNNARRRRVILDEAVQANQAQLATAQTTVKSTTVDLANTYSREAKRRGQMKTTDLIPKRAIPLAIVVASVLLGLLLINFLAFNAPNWSVLSPDAAQAFGFTGIGTISSWFSSLLLMITGMASLQIYGMRRHRFDDYNGHYRVWIFLAVLFSIASVNCVVDFRAIVNSLVQAAGFANGKGVVVLLVAKLVALTALVVRGILEIRASKSALAAVVVVWIAYASAIFTKVPSIEDALVQNGEMVYGNLVLIGNIALFLSVISFARFVYLHANELIKLEKADVKKSEKVSESLKATSAEQTTVEVDASPADAESEEVQSEQDEKILTMPLGGKIKKANQKRRGKKAAKKACETQRRAA